MADEKVTVGPEGSKTPEAPAASWPGDPLTPEHTEGPLFLAGIRRPLPCGARHAGAVCYPRHV